MKASILCKKQVVSVKNGEILGRIHDFELDLEHFEIESVCIKKKKSFFSSIFSVFFNETEIVVDVDRIISIGTDVVLADLSSSQKKQDKRK